MKRSRILVCTTLLVLYFCFIIFKLADIQLFSPDAYGPEKVNLLKKSVEQRITEIELSSGRGVLLDRFNKPLGTSKVEDIVLFPFLATMDLPPTVSLMLNQLAPMWQQQLKTIKKPIFLSQLLDKQISEDMVEQVKNADIPGMIAVRRDGTKDPTIAEHLIGLVRDNPKEYDKRYGDVEKSDRSIGISGIQKAFDSFLQAKQQEKLMYSVDAIGNPLLGLDLRYVGSENDYYPLKLSTTIDSDIQQMIETTVDSYGMKKGGVVLLDVRTNELVSLLSRPKMDTEQPFATDTVRNQMLTAHFPGSVFKTVIAAAAIENDEATVNNTYDCDLNVYGDGASDRKLGELNFIESFAKSCNYTFATIGKKLVGENNTIIETYADKLGLLGPVGWVGNIFHLNNFKQFPEEENGKIWGDVYDRSVQRAIAQTAIGQKEVKVTPLAVANMISTIVNNGVKREIRVVDKILYNNGTVMKQFPDHYQKENQLEKETAVKLKKMLTEVVENGTGSYLKQLSVAGKSGTAQIGKENRYNHWFAGFFPVENPRYVMVVVDLDQTNDQAKTYPIYQAIVKQLTSEGSP
ncbi:peptidoglycan D,D-transpeptidase FtsI family protein [Aquibacillus salsiterrae]|uniref:serine-type D-Ala-D-Ala carboxypeptidase n=1 Tax=Aquibacillus salsiterrae TaxID=2950439 RepID=A0A9X3WAI2_9BACI|nr:penicillin-binding transpeptidase domain-containing protein [Aquibacillus salsiterrae]MDC3415607.1 penicillin-binding transpeptidase domain-containing protein [Aquibacillus salsiterrae]